MKLGNEARFRLGAAEVRPAERELVHADGRETLEPRVMEVLIVLAKAKGEVVSRDALVETCWEGRAVTDDAINRVIYRLRKLAEQSGGAFAVETIAKVGYRLTAKDADAAAPLPEAAATRSPPRPNRAVLAAIAAGLVALLALVWWIARPAAPPPAAPMLAVMPFDNLSGEAPDTITHGLPRELRDRLARMRGLRVIADSSSAALATENIDALEIGRRLNVDLLLDGAVQLRDAALRIHIELVDARTGAVAWSHTYDGPAADLAAADADLSAALLEHMAQRLGTEVASAGEARVMSPETFGQILEARTELQTALDIMRSGDMDAGRRHVDRSVAILTTVVAREPENATALAMLGNLAPRGWLPESSDDAAENWRISADYLRRALAADPDNPNALTSLAEYYRRYEWRWLESQRLFERALAIDPNNPDAQSWYTYQLTTTGRCREALAHARIAAELDPSNTWVRMATPRVLKCLGRAEESDALFMRELDGARGNVFLASEIYLNYFVRREPEKIRALQQRLRDLWNGAPPPPVATLLTRMDAGVAALEGDGAPLLAIVEADAAIFVQDEATPYLDARRNGDLAFMLSIEAAWAGAPERAIDLLEFALQTRSLYITEVMPYGAYEFTPEVRANPRYQALLRRDPAMVELMELRLNSVRDRQMEGMLPDGRRVSARRI